MGGMWCSFFHDFERKMGEKKAFNVKSAPKPSKNASNMYRNTIKM